MGIPTLISTATASNAANVDITSGIDSTYDEYMFVFTDINPSSDDYEFTFQVNAANQSGFNETMTTTFFRAQHPEDDSSATLTYLSGSDQAQGTAFQRIGLEVHNASDASLAGELHLFNPSNTTYVKHFYSRANYMHGNVASFNTFAAGYVNVDGAVDEVQFKMSSGNFDGTIKMYGVG